MFPDLAGAISSLYTEDASNLSTLSEGGDGVSDSPSAAVPMRWAGLGWPGLPVGALRIHARGQNYYIDFSRRYLRAAHLAT